jgi:hypothetical protein
MTKSQEENNDVLEDLEREVPENDELTEEQKELQEIEEGLIEALDKEDRKQGLESGDEEVEEKPQEEEEPEEEDLSDEHEVSPEEEEEAPVEDDLSAPGTWNAEKREIFDTMSSEAKRLVRSEMAALQGMQTREAQKRAYLEKQVAPLQGYYEQFEQQIRPFKGRWQHLQIPDHVVVGNVLKAQELIEQDPIRGINHLLEQKGLVPEDLYEQGPVPQEDPRVQQLERKVTQFEEDQKRAKENEQRIAAEQQNRQVSQTSAEFAQEKDANGKFLRPYLQNDEIKQELAEDMAHRSIALSQQHPELSLPQVLQKAYEEACWVNPRIREMIQSKNEKRQRRAKRTDVAAKKKAGSSIKGNSSSPPVPKGTPEDLGELIAGIVDGEIT